VAQISNIVTSRAFLEKARLTQLVEQLPNSAMHDLEDLESPCEFGTSCGFCGHKLFSSYSAPTRNLMMPRSCCLRPGLKAAKGVVSLTQLAVVQRSPDPER